jgi:hypothetical protein
LEDAAAVTRYDNMARAEMQAIGIPEEMIGNVPGTVGQGQGAFSPHATVGGTHTPPLIQGTYTPRINVDAGVLDANRFSQISPTWGTASLEARMQAVAAHEYTEALVHQAGRAGAYPQGVLDAIAVANDINARPAAVRRAVQTIHDYGHNLAIANAANTGSEKVSGTNGTVGLSDLF